jgi:hypothetical protein
MKKIFDKNTCCTDPGSLQFCLPVSDGEFWYCEPNGFNDRLLPGTGSIESLILQKYAGNPQQFLKDAQKDSSVKAFIRDRQLWLSGKIDVKDFSEEEKCELLSDYAYRWEDFSNDSERNQIICEIYFESYPVDFRNDI